MKGLFSLRRGGGGGAQAGLGGGEELMKPGGKGYSLQKRRIATEPRLNVRWGVAREVIIGHILWKLRGPLGKNNVGQSDHSRRD